MTRVTEGETVRVKVEHSGNPDEVKVWCKENIGKRFDTWDRDWHFGNHWIYVFSREQDATMFLLRWS
jgi:hypothetical protein